MQVEFLLNGGVSLILSPENQMEEELLKGLMKQNNEITEFRTALQVLNKTFRTGIVVGKKSSGPSSTTDTKSEEPLGDDKA